MSVLSFGHMRLARISIWPTHHWIFRAGSDEADSSSEDEMPQDLDSAKRKLMAMAQTVNSTTAQLPKTTTTSSSNGCSPTAVRARLRRCCR